MTKEDHRQFCTARESKECGRTVLSKQVFLTKKKRVSHKDKYGDVKVLVVFIGYVLHIIIHFIDEEMSCRALCVVMTKNTATSLIPLLCI